MLKFKQGGKDVTLDSIEMPKNAKEVQPEGLVNSERVLGNKGENAMSKFYGYLLLDKYAVVEAKINGKPTPYNCGVCILISLETHKPIKAGTVSLNSFTRANFKYTDMETLQIERCKPQFVDVKTFDETTEGIYEYYKNNLAGKVWVPTGAEEDAIRVRFVDNTPTYLTAEGQALPTRKIPEFKEADFTVDFGEEKKEDKK